MGWPWWFSNGWTGGAPDGLKCITVTEPELILLLKRKDRAAFKQVVETWQDMVYNTTLSLLQNAADAEDVTQDTFVQVYESIGSFKEASRLSTWIYRIAVSKALDHIRRKRRKKRFAFLESIFDRNDRLVKDPPDFVHPGIQAEKKESARVLFQALEKLPLNQQSAFVLNKVEGLTYREVGEIMELTESAVDALLHRAKANLKKILHQYYEQSRDG